MYTLICRQLPLDHFGTEANVTDCDYSQASSVSVCYWIFKRFCGCLFVIGILITISSHSVSHTESKNMPLLDLTEFLSDSEESSVMCSKPPCNDNPI